MSELLFKMAKGIKEIPIHYGIPLGGLLPDPQHTLETLNSRNGRV